MMCMAHYCSKETKVSFLPPLQVWGDHAAPDAAFGAVGDVRLMPAQDAELRPLPWYPSHAIAICDMHEMPGMLPIPVTAHVISCQ
jgi:hypothetical protein